HFPDAGQRFLDLSVIAEVASVPLAKPRLVGRGGEFGECFLFQVTKLVRHGEPSGKTHTPRNMDMSRGVRGSPIRSWMTTRTLPVPWRASLEPVPLEPADAASPVPQAW